MTPLEIEIRRRFASQFLDDRFEERSEAHRVANFVLSRMDLLALRDDVVQDAHDVCRHVDCEEATASGDVRIESALGNAWNAAPRRRMLQLPAWPWR